MSLEPISDLRRLLTCILVIGLLPGLCAAYNVAVGSYVVPNPIIDDQAISVSPSFAITLVIIKCDSTNNAVWSVAAMGADKTVSFVIGAVAAADKIQSMGTGTFQVGLSADVQPAIGATCYYAVFGDDGNNDFATGEYLADGVVDTDIVISPAFQPDMVAVQCYSVTCASAGAFRTTAHGADSTSLFSAAADAANRIKQFNANGFRLGTSSVTNTASSRYAYVAFKAIASHNASISYTGTLVDDTQVSTIGNPIFALLKANSSGSTACGRWGSAGDLSWLLSNTAAAADRLQTFNGSGVVLGLGTCAQQNGIITRGWVTRQPTYGTVRRRHSPMVLN